METTLVYLHLTQKHQKVAFANSRIIKVENNTVFFRYVKPSSRRLRTMALDALEFIRRFLQHVLPTGFIDNSLLRIHDPNCSVPFEKVSTLIQMAYAFSMDSASPFINVDWSTKNQEP